jgi:phosphoribosylaminoimidazole (AIR) synthetase
VADPDVHSAYRQAGVDYAVLDAGKRSALTEALATSHWLAAGGARAIDESRGEPAFVLRFAGSTLAFVLETLGTKSVLAREYHELAGVNRFDHVAYDTVAAVLNDLICVGALPLVLNAYFATGSSAWYEHSERAGALLAGWRRACDDAQCTWGGGESPSLTDLLAPEEIELAGSALGFVPPPGEPLLGGDLAAGDEIVLIPSSGLHANGASLARRVAAQLPDGLMTELPGGPPRAGGSDETGGPEAERGAGGDHSGVSFGEAGGDHSGVSFGEAGSDPSGVTFGEAGSDPSGVTFGEAGSDPSGVTFGEAGSDPSGVTFGEALLAPSHLYVELVRRLLGDAGVRLTYLSHITGHGLLKLMRPQRELAYRIHALPPVPPVLAFLAAQAELDPAAAYSTLNMGVGFAVYCRPGGGAHVVEHARELGLDALLAGAVEEGPRRVILEPVEVTFTGDQLALAPDSTPHPRPERAC